MFGFVADILTVLTTVLFPIFASYKALHTSDPALLAPWLMYFVTLSLVTAIESTFDFILSWIPFYAWLRFLIHLYLILPGSQGASSIYLTYIEPFLYQNEREIDTFLTDAHDRAKSAGLNYLQQGVEWFKINVLGFAPQKRQAPPPAGQTYAQNFMSRFSMPNARGDNLTNLVSQALSGASALYAGNQSAQADNLSRSAPLVPDNIRNNEDRLSYVQSQRERLATLMQAFDREEGNLRSQRESGSRYYEAPGGLAQSRSEVDFDRIERDEIGQGAPPPYPMTPPAFDRRTSQGGWLPWNWRGQPERGREEEDDDLAYGRERDRDRERERDRDRERHETRARASGFDLGDRDDRR